MHIAQCTLYSVQLVLLFDQAMSMTASLIWYLFCS
jgi:hypothetical protein